MSRPHVLRTRDDFRHANGVLLVLRDVPSTPRPVPGQPPAVAGDPAEGPEVLLSVWDDGSVVALHGHVDLGTGIRTALTQIVAEELDVPMAHVERSLMGDTAVGAEPGRDDRERVDPDPRERRCGWRPRRRVRMPRRACRSGASGVAAGATGRAIDGSRLRSRDRRRHRLRDALLQDQHIALAL